MPAESSTSVRLGIFDVLASERKYVPVRRALLFLEERPDRGTRRVVFAPNNELLFGADPPQCRAFTHNLFRQRSLGHVAIAGGLLVPSAPALASSRGDADLLPEAWRWLGACGERAGPLRATEPLHPWRKTGL